MGDGARLGQVQSVLIFARLNTVIEGFGGAFVEATSSAAAALAMALLINWFTVRWHWQTDLPEAAEIPHTA